MRIEKLSFDTITNEKFDDIVELENNCGLEPFSPEMLMLDLRFQENWACIENEHIVAFITVSVEEGYYMGDLFVFNLNVGNAYRRKGLATKLIEKALLEHPECEYMTLDCRLDNEKAMNLYRKLGFEKDEMPSLNGESDIVMRADRKRILSSLISE